MLVGTCPVTDCLQNRIAADFGGELLNEKGKPMSS